MAKRWKTRNPKINPWLGGFFLKLPETSVSDTWVFHSGVTFGTGDKNISPGILAGSIEGDELFKGFSLHGQVRLGRKAWLVSENYFLLREASLTPVCLSGFRRNSRSFALELGIGWTKTVRSTLDANPGKAHYVPFPWLGLVFRMPKKPGVLGG